jgi:hypothetical protein
LTHHDTVQALGVSAMDRGEHEEAARHLGEALDINKAAWGNCPCIVVRYALVARNLSMQGRFDEAEAVLASAPNMGTVLGQTVGDPMTYANGPLLARARVKLDRGDPAAALALLPADEGDTEEWADEHRSLLRGAALCALGRAREGLPLMETYAEKLAKQSFAYHPRVAHWRAVTGLCALDAGNEPRAMELAQLARQAFTQQSGVSPYYKAPLLTLEKRLTRR